MIEGIEFIEDNQAAKAALLKTGLLDPLLRQKVPSQGPKVRAVFHSSETHHFLGLSFSDCRQGGDNGFALIKGDRNRVTPGQWALIVTSIVGTMGDDGSASFSNFDLGNRCAN